MIATVVILSLNAFASLRESDAIKGMEKFFTPRRQGAKKATVKEPLPPGRDRAVGRSIEANRPHQERVTAWPV